MSNYRLKPKLTNFKNELIKYSKSNILFGATEDTKDLRPKIENIQFIEKVTYTIADNKLVLFLGKKPMMPKDILDNINSIERHMVGNLDENSIIFVTAIAEFEMSMHGKGIRYNTEKNKYIYYELHESKRYDRE